MLDLSRQKKRNNILDMLEYLKTCVLARELCFHICENRSVLNAEDIHEYCSFISHLCKEAGCKEASDLCAKAANIVTKEEEGYLNLCQQSCELCHEGRPQTKSKTKETSYVA
jgi:hypothetical protein